MAHKQLNYDAVKNKYKTGVNILGMIYPVNKGKNIKNSIFSLPIRNKN
jgi:hypothetical protein